MITKYKRFIKFVFVAASYNLVGYGFFFGLVYIGVNYLISSLLSFVFGMMLSFFMNRAFVFALKKYNLKIIVKYIIFYSALLVINLSFLHFFVKSLNLTPYMAQILVMMIFAVISYNMMRVFIFGDTHD